MGRNKVNIEDKKVGYPTYIRRSVFLRYLKKRGNKKNLILANTLTRVLYHACLCGIEELETKLQLKKLEEYEELLKDTTQDDTDNTNKS